MLHIKSTDIKFIESKYIDKQKWDNTLSESDVNNVFMYSWYLDAVSDNWGGVISDDYSTILPVTYTCKLGVKQFNQVIFTREFEVVGSQFTLTEGVLILKRQFKNIQFRTNKKIGNNNSERIHQYIELNESFSGNYSTNAKRLIKKSNKNYTYQVVNCVNELIELVEQNVAHKIKEFTPKNIEKLNVLMDKAFGVNKGETIAVFDDGNIVASGFFLKDKSTITYLKGASNEVAKKNGAMFGLMDFAFSRYNKDFSIFDFGGSNIESVANFYKKFGAKDRIYYEYTINELPLWFKVLKKLKK